MNNSGYRYSTYDPNTGRFLQVNCVPENYQIFDEHIPGEFSDEDSYVDLEVTPPAQRYKNNPPFALNKSTIAADLVDEIVVDGIPAHTLVQWPDGSTEIVNDGRIEYITDVPGTKSIVIDAVAYLPIVLTFEVE